jgi:N-acetylneuraminate synthase
MSVSIQIGNSVLGTGSPTYVIAEISANHNQKLESAKNLIHLAKECGADAVKLQTYTPDTLTIKSDKPHFRIGGGTLWDGKTLYDLYAEAYTPWDWHSELKAIADDLQIHLFSSPFDATAVDLLEKINVPAYKIASFEIVDLPLIEYVARTGKPIIMSTGMASESEVQEAIDTAKEAGATQIALLKCTSAYPASPDSMNLQTIPWMKERFGVPVGLSDHTMGIAAPVAAVALGACIIEKHFTLSRSVQGPDSAFSLEPQEFKAMVEAVRVAERSLGTASMGTTAEEEKGRVFRRSLFVVEDIKAGERFTQLNVRSIRPGYGLHTRYLKEILGKTATQDIERGTPLAWDMIAGGRTDH